MMSCRPSESEMRETALESIRDRAYQPIALMNRAERRTARGRQMVAEAESAELKAENEYLREQLGIPDC